MRRSIDDRVQTRVSTVFAQPFSEEQFQIRKPSIDPQSLIRWAISPLTELLYSDPFVRKYGAPCIFESLQLCCVGTSEGFILLSDYQGRVRDLFRGDGSKVTALALSGDGSHIAGGFSSGLILLWKVSDPQTPLLSISPRHENSDGHEAAVVQLNFLGKSSRTLISADVSGCVFYNNVYKSILGSHLITRRIYETSSPFFSCCVLPLGTRPDPIDSLGIIAVISSRHLCLISLHPVPKVLLKMTEKNADIATAALMPCTESYPTRIAYCWSNRCVVAEIDAAVDPARLNLRHKKQVVLDEDILLLRWIDDGILCALTKGQRAVLIDTESVKAVATVDIISKNLESLDLLPTYYNALSTFKGQLSLLGKYTLQYGRIIDWKMVLEELFQTGNYHQLLETMVCFYLGVADLELFRLCKVNEQRHLTIMPLVLQMVEKCLEASVSEPEKFINAYLQLCCAASLPETYLDALAENYEPSVFFGVLEPFIYSEKISCLSPGLLQKMVAHYIAAGEGPKLEELICTVDIKTLDVDSTTKLCKEYGLQEALIYIWNVLLVDFVSPLFELFVQMIEDEESAVVVFPYLTYILTGRQYPTEKPLSSDRAKLDLYHVIFSGVAICWPTTSKLHVVKDAENEPAFPYLFLLLKFNCFETLATLNEVFEDSFLNNDNPQGFSRQYIVDTLIGIFEANEFSKLHLLYFSVFIAITFPKYQQFIRLAPSFLDECLLKISLYHTQDEQLRKQMELGLQAVLSVHHPGNADALFVSLQENGFHQALFTLYSSEHKVTNMLQLLASGNIEFASMDILERLFQQSAADHTRMEKVVQDNFGFFLQQTDIYSLVKIIDHYAPDLHYSVLGPSISEALQYKYLSQLMRSSSTGSAFKYKDPDDKLKLKFVEVGCQLNQDVKDFVFSTQFKEKQVLYAILERTSHQEWLIDLLRQSGEEEQAFKITLECLSRSETDQAAFQKFLHTSADICEHQTLVKGSSCEAMWLDLIELTVSFFNTNKSLSIAKSGVQECFTRLISSTANERSEKTFFSIFSAFLNRSSAKTTALGDVRSVLDEIWIAYALEQQICQVSFQLYSGDLFSELIDSHMKKLRGWTIAKVHCEACGKALWGSQIQPKAYLMWEEHAKGGTVPKNTATKESDMAIVAFECRHGFHVKCLKGLGGKYECILCDPE